MLPRKLFQRAIILVLDSVGSGALPDAADFGDEGADTLGNIQKSVGLSMPNSSRIGLGRLLQNLDPDKEKSFFGASGRLGERSAGKDTLTGHWEMAGIVNDSPFVTYPEGFPRELIQRFEKAIGRRVLGNTPASGTEILKDLGSEHMKSGDVIVYTSADSVFQVAAHEEVVPLDELYKICKIAREMLRGEHNIARVIARPFLGSGPADFQRTPNRKDYAVDPPAPTLLDQLCEHDEKVIGVGKIRDIYNGKGITLNHKTVSNEHGLELTQSLIAKGGEEALLFVNLVDFDMLYGHRRDPKGYRNCLQDFDLALPSLIAAMHEGDALFITADHGNDPTFPGSDHTREYAPILITGTPIAPVALGDRACFADLGQTIAENFGLELAVGESMLDLLSPT